VDTQTAAATTPSCYTQRAEATTPSCSEAAGVESEANGGGGGGYAPVHYGRVGREGGGAAGGAGDL
jgi:hypothetical protein